MHVHIDAYGFELEMISKQKNNQVKLSLSQANVRENLSKNKHFDSNLKFVTACQI